MTVEIKRHEWTAKGFMLPGEHIVCALILGPDRDDPNLKTLHLRSNADAIDIFREASIEARISLMQKVTMLFESFIERVLR